MDTTPRKPDQTFASIGFPRITVDPAVMTGQPCIRGLRMPVATVVKLVASGLTPPQILQEYPFLESEDIHQALSFAAWHTEESYVLLAPAP